MARPKTSIYAAGITCLGFICFILAAAAVGIPIWGHYDSPSGGYYDSDRGYFSLFKVCKQLTYNREKCGSDVSKFQLASSVYVSGLLAILSTVALGIYCILAIIQMAMISSREKVVMKYTSLVLFKMFMALIGCLLAIIATILFAVQIDDSENYGFRVTRGISFYIQIAVIGLTIALFVASVYDMLFSRKPDGDPTMAIDTSPANATTFNNPGFKEGRTRNGVSVTDASGKPYSGIRNGGSVASMNTTLTSVSNGSTVESSVVRSPLRSSLKKPRPKETLGIQNPGFSGSGHSPPMNRNGSVKKVRIQTHSTEV